MTVTRASSLALSLAVLLCSERPASACGGTFCDSGPRAMPVDQKGENILFVTDGTSVEAHVQIQYKGDPSRFAWIVPMPAVPTVTVGSEQLFTNLLQGTVPSYGYFIQQDSCPCFNCSFGAGGATAAGGFGGTSGAADAGATPGVNVIFRKSVGAFDVTALQGHSAAEVIDWLSANGYQSISTAPGILAKYVAKGSVFVAVKLTASAGNDQIHPLVFKYRGTEPCIPLELTAVAAVPDMGVRAFFLGSSRVVSTNYAHVTLNSARIDWSTMGGNYNDVVSKAVDAAGGHGFVTEYAGASNVVGQFNFTDARWDESAFIGSSSAGAVQELEMQGLLACYAGGVLPDAGYGKVCTSSHPLTLPILHEFIPVPSGVGEGEFYSCVSCFPTSPDAAAFDSQKFATALHDRIFEPARHAAAILARWPYLTRLFTTISPAEMTLDPFFEARQGLAEVSLPTTATWRRTMTSASGFMLPSGEDVALDGSAWPAFTSAMPWAARIESYPAGQPSTLIADNASAIQSQLDAWNTSQGWPLPPPNCPMPPGGGGFGGTAGFTSGSAGSGPGRPGAGGTTADGGASRTPTAPVSFASSDSGCGVARAPASGVAAWFAALSSLAVIARRRRRAAGR